MCLISSLRRISDDIIIELMRSIFCFRRNSHGLKILNKLANRWAKEAEVEVRISEPEAVKDVAVSFILYLFFLLLQDFILLGELLIIPGEVTWASLFAASSSS
ncbi:hypothetical protein ACOSP7_013289 [Xanthoceras sorbifolium]